MGLPIEENQGRELKTLPTFKIGGGVIADYYLSSFDGGLLADFEYRFSRHHSAGLFSQVYVGGELFEIGLSYRFYFIGNLLDRHYEDYLRLGFSGIYMEKWGENYFPPVITLGYGRDVIFFEKVNILGRIEFNCKYIAGEPIAKENERIYITEESHFIMGLEFSIMCF